MTSSELFASVRCTYNYGTERMEGRIIGHSFFNPENRLVFLVWNPSTGSFAECSIYDVYTDTTL